MKKLITICLLCIICSACTTKTVVKHVDFEGDIRIIEDFSNRITYEYKNTPLDKLKLKAVLDCNKKHCRQAQLKNLYLHKDGYRRAEILCVK